MEEYVETRHYTGSTESIFGSEVSCVKGNFSVYQVYKTRSNFEQLMLTPGFFKELISNNNHDRLKMIFLDLLKNLKLTRNDSIDFSEMDLSNFSFENAELGSSKFTNAKLNGVNFIKTNLMNCQGLTQDQLDSTCYNAALLSNKFSVYWNMDIKNNLLNHLENLKDYAKKNIPANHTKSAAIETLYHKYEPILKNPSNPSMQVKLKMLEDFKKYMNQNSFHRNYYFLIKETLTFLAMCVIPYLAVSSYNLYKTGYFGIYTQPTSRKKASEYIKCINDNDTNLIAKSNVR